MGKYLKKTIEAWAWRRLREGKSFRKISLRLKEIDYFSKDQIEELQQRKLKQVIRHSYLNVPYYRRLIDNEGLDINGKFAAKDLPRIPLLTRSELLENTPDFISRHSKRIFLKKADSSGTTGCPIVLYRDYYSINFESAIWWKQRDWAGIMRGDKKVTLRGEMVQPGWIKSPPFWRYDHLAKELILSSYHISRDTVRDYVDVLKRFKPLYVEAYPSSLYILARLIKECGLKGVSFKVAITSSEMLPDYKKALIEKVFDCKVYDFYGTTERVIAIATCPSGNYHILPEYGFAEFLDCKDKEGQKELVGTSFLNMCMPLIRYRTGDLIKLSEKECECGRRSQVVEKIIGRLNESIVTPEGRIITMLCPIYKGLSNMIETQIIQEDYSTIKVKLIPGKDFSSSDEEMLVSRLLERLGNNMKIYVEKVDFIERTARGKIKNIISNIKDRKI